MTPLPIQWAAVYLEVAADRLQLLGILASDRRHADCSRLGRHAETTGSEVLADAINGTRMVGRESGDGPGSDPLTP